MNLAIIKAVKSLALTKFPTQIRFLSSHKSEIFTTAGIIFGIGTTITACRSTLKMVSIIEDAKTKLEQVQQAKEIVQSEGWTADQYTVEDAKKDTIQIYAQALGKSARLYAPVVVLGALSVGFIIGGHNILRRENAALAVAFTGVTEAFKRYRGRIVNEYGKEKEQELYLGAEKVLINTTDEQGKTTHATSLVVDKNNLSQYARFFDEENPNFSRNPDLNLFFLRQQQQWANDKLKARGHLFLNEVYDMLGFPRSQAGCYVGWVDGQNALGSLNGDDFVDFGIYQGINQKTNDFVNGIRNTVLLDFNVDGAIDEIFTQKRFNQKMIDPRS